jgi:hypothetical protein
MSAPAVRVLALVLVLGTSGCSTALPPWVPFARSSDDASGRSVGAPCPTSAAVRPGEGVDAETLYQIGLSQTDPTSGTRDYRAARATFTRLLIEFPRSRRDAEARAWQATLTDLLVREDDAHRYAQRVQRLEEERKRTKSAYEWLKQTDLDREPRR